MQLAAHRPHISAGVALASAAVIAAGPMAQHLPKFDVAQHLPQVSVTDINLTDAASPMMDLFAGVENELAQLASGGATAAAVPAAALTDFLNPSALPLPVATWVNTLQTAGSNLEQIFNNWSATPFPILQQVLANNVSYANFTVTKLQGAATTLMTYFTTTNKTGFQFLFGQALSQLAAGQVSTGLNTLLKATYTSPVQTAGLPLEILASIPAYMSQNFTNGLDTLTTPVLTNFGLFQILGLPNVFVRGLGGGLQPVFNSWAGADLPGTLTNLANVPGIMANNILNGINGGGTEGILSANTSGLLNSLLVYYPQLIASNIVSTPTNATDITSGGSLTAALQDLGYRLVNGWPSLTPLINNLSAGLTQLLSNLPSILSNIPSVVGGFLSAQVGLLITGILKLL